jgi:hypothetical protein
VAARAAVGEKLGAAVVNLDALGAARGRERDGGAERGREQEGLQGAMHGAA